MRFLSADGTTAVSIDNGAAADILEHCRKAGRAETGGILIGRYSELGDRAVVIEASGPPRDSRRFAFAFWRGIVGLRTLLADRWRKTRHHYLGEWHFHPFSSAEPSERHLTQMAAFAADADYRCPRPVLIVIGGDPANEYGVEAVVLQDGRVIRLERQAPHDPALRSQSATAEPVPEGRPSDPP